MEQLNFVFATLLLQSGLKFCYYIGFQSYPEYLVSFEREAKKSVLSHTNTQVSEFAAPSSHLMRCTELENLVMNLMQTVSQKQPYLVKGSFRNIHMHMYVWCVYSLF